MSLPSTSTDDAKREQAIMVYNLDWSSTSLGPMDLWEPTIKTAMSHIFIINFTKITPLLKLIALGKPMRDVWSKPLCDTVIAQLEE
ncbi:21391_t:CDS:2 [Dentiscutata erythropus]|uniref:21391_t:CDS:1 n=1 Tax=Dentiscutata erythropus TaxID=1348616 RepID=A0A9N9G1I2_9GLOM|nr:21391_t:CDS:2 [Dentiscutata erythropus]